jgi:serine/threonine-protein phosphatase 4 catalytic subunit
MISLSALVDSSIFCVHGGLGPETKLIDEIKSLHRKQEPPHEGPICDLMWSDPEEGLEGFQKSSRGAGHIFGGDTVEQFNRKNNVTLICRAHQLVMEGYKTMFLERLVTVWSAPNYCYRCGNVAAILELDENLQRAYKIFEAAPENVRGIGGKKSVPDYFM